MNRTFVLYRDKTPAMPCHPARARALLGAGKAAVFRRAPFTIILTHRKSGEYQPVALKLDPGSKTTGIALVANEGVVFAANLEHRGAAIKTKLETRRTFRRSRRARKTRYRAPRFDNRTTPEGWLPPSLVSRVQNVASWAQRLMRFAPITSTDVESVRFDMQAMQTPGISGVEYQQGTLIGYEVREYLLEKFNRTCVYCDATGVPLQIEHVVPRAAGGSNRISNLTLACGPCNTAKDTQRIDTFLASTPTRLARIKAQLKTPLHDAAAVNATRYAIGNALKALGLPTAFWSGGRTKMNRMLQGYAKDHWIDAACVGMSGAAVRIAPNTKALAIKAIGRGSRQMCKPDKYGFPRTNAKRVKRTHGFQTGDLVRLVQPSGKYAGTYIGTVAVRARGDFDLKNSIVKITSAAKNFTLLQRTNGYSYAA